MNVFRSYTFANYLIGIARIYPNIISCVLKISKKYIFICNIKLWVIIVVKKKLKNLKYYRYIITIKNSKNIIIFINNNEKNCNLWILIG